MILWNKKIRDKHYVQNKLMHLTKLNIFTSSVKKRQERNWTSTIKWVQPQKSWVNSKIVKWWLLSRMNMTMMTTVALKMNLWSLLKKINWGFHWDQPSNLKVQIVSFSQLDRMNAMLIENWKRYYKIVMRLKEVCLRRSMKHQSLNKNR